MDGAPLWAQALFLHMDNKIDMLGDYVQDMDGILGVVYDQLDMMARGPLPVDVTETDNVVEAVAVPEANGANDVEKWAKLVERFNNLKPVAFDGKGNLTLA